MVSHDGDRLWPGKQLAGCDLCGDVGRLVIMFYVFFFALMGVVHTGVRVYVVRALLVLVVQRGFRLGLLYLRVSCQLHVHRWSGGRDCGNAYRHLLHDDDFSYDTAFPGPAIEVHGGGSG